MAARPKVKAVPARLTARKAPPASTVMSHEVPASPAESLSLDKVVAMVLAEAEGKRKALLQEIKAECERDPEYLDLVLRELKPLRKRGHAAAPPWKEAAAGRISVAMKGEKRIKIVETIAATLKPGQPAPDLSQAQRLYDKVRKRKT